MSTVLFKTMTSTIKNSKNQARKLIRTILNMQNFHLKILLIIRKNLTLRKKLRRLSKIKKRRVSKILLKYYSVISFHPKQKANIFFRIFSNLADSLLLKLPRPKKKKKIESKPLEKIISRFVISVTILFHTM